MTRSRFVDGTLLAALFCVTFEKLSWNVAGNVELADLLTLVFLGAFAAERLRQRDGRFPTTVAVLLGFFAVFLLVYLAGYFNMETTDAVAQFTKGLGKFCLHFALLACGVATLYRRGERAYWRALGWFTAGLVANGIYGIVQLVAARGGVNLDHLLITPLTGTASAINKYGAVNDTAVNRTNALTGDPNHLGIMLAVPLLLLLPIFLRLEKGNRWRNPLGLVLAFLLLVDVTTLSRSGALGLIAGGLVLALPYRHEIFSARFFAMVGAVTLLLAAYTVTHRHYVEVVVKSRIQTGGSSTSPHTAVYAFIPKILHMHPLLGLGLNNFSVYYRFATGKTDWGPHSFYVALIVETGLIGTLLFALFLWYVFRRVGAVRRIGRALARAGDPLAAHVSPLGWGLTAALVGTMAANAFYLTMSFYYFYALLMLALAAPLVFGQRLRGDPPG
ncbi:MAG: O-Antigen ligase [Gaiellaceae bacterium]|nr:O-Antigen ligase [Gaiellaceae bacterium]